MRNSRALVALILVLALTGLAGTTEAVAGDKKAVKKATEKFYEALNELFKGEVKPMKKVWSQKKDVTYMGPAGGMQIGWTEVLANWEAQAALMLGGEVQPSEIVVFAGDEIGVSQTTEVGTNLNVDGQTVDVKIRATNIFRKEGGNWKMIGHHTDLLPELAN